jgi:hypothetical protein
MDEGWCHWVFLDWICRGFVDRLEIVDRPGTSFPSMAPPLAAEQHLRHRDSALPSDPGPPKLLEIPRRLWRRR